MSKKAISMYSRSSVVKVWSIVCINSQNIVQMYSMFLGKDLWTFVLSVYVPGSDYLVGNHVYL